MSVSGWLEVTDLYRSSARFLTIEVSADGEMHQVVPTFFIAGRDFTSVVEWTSPQDEICAERHSINPMGMFRQCPDKLAL